MSNNKYIKLKKNIFVKKLLWRICRSFCQSFPKSILQYNIIGVTCRNAIFISWFCCAATCATNLLKSTRDVYTDVLDVTNRIFIPKKLGGVMQCDTMITWYWIFYGDAVTQGKIIIWTNNMHIITCISYVLSKWKYPFF